jgi:hypothetical protein
MGFINNKNMNDFLKQLTNDEKEILQCLKKKQV